MPGLSQNKISGYSVFLTMLLAIITGYVFKWSHDECPVNFMGGYTIDTYAEEVRNYNYLIN